MRDSRTAPTVVFTIGRSDANGNPIIAMAPHYEETFGANKNTVDNYRSLMPLVPRAFRYNITLLSKGSLTNRACRSKDR